MDDKTPQVPDVPEPNLTNPGANVVQPTQTAAPQTTPSPAPMSTTATEPTPTPNPVQPMSGSFNASSSKKKMPKLFVPVLAGLIIVLGGGAFAYLGVYKNQPDVVWKDSMSNTARGIKEFSALDGSLQGGSSFKANFSMEKPTAVTGSVEGKAKDKNSQTTGTVSAAGAKIDFDLRTLGVADSDYPDIYAKVIGLNSVSALAGPEMAEQISQFEDRWLYIDHTLLAQAAQSATQNAETGSADITLTEEDIRTIRTKYAEVLSQYVFTTDESKAIMQRTGEATKEDFDGKPTVKYAVNINKENLKSFATAMKDATKDTKLKEIIAPGDKSLEEALNFEDMLKSIDEMDVNKAKIEVWADKGKRFIRNVRITPQDEGNNSTVDIGLNYSSGNDYPFYIRINGDDEEAKGGVVIDMTVNSNSKKVTFAVNGDIDYKDGDSQDTKFKVTAEMQPSNDDVNPEKPEGAMNIMELLGGMMQPSMTIEDPAFSEDLPLFDDTEL